MKAHAHRRAALLLAVLASCSRHCSNGPKPLLDGALPACRVARDHQAIIEQTAREAFRRVAARQPLDFTRLDVNPARVDAKVLPLFVVSDASTGDVDDQQCIKAGARHSPGAPLDPVSVRGVCRAHEGAVQCSAGALEAILSDGRENASPFLFFLFAHELTHIALHHPGAATGTAFSLDLAADRGRKLSDLSAACLVDQDQVAREQAADDGALAAITTAFGEPPFAAPGTSPVLSLLDNTERVYQSFHRLMDWSQEFYGKGSAFAAPEEYSACEVLKADSGTIEFPQLGGDHPHSWRRVGSLMSWAARAVSGLDVTTMPPDVRARVSGLNMNAMVDSTYGFARDALVNRFCKDVRLLATQKLDCSSRGPAPALPVVDREDLDAVGLPPSAPPETFEIPPPTRRTHRDVTGAAVDLFLEIVPRRSLPNDKARADAEARDLARDIGAYLDQVDEELTRTGGFFVYTHLPPVSASYNAIIGSYLVDTHCVVAARVPASFDVSRVHASAALTAANAVSSSKRPPADATYEAVLQFYADPNDAKHDSKRLLTKAAGLDAYFDLARARAGHENEIAPGFAHLLCYARERLRAHYGAPFTLEKNGDVEQAFYLVVIGTDAHNLYFPSGWAPIATSGCARASPPDRPAAGRFLRLYDYGHDSEEVPSEEFRAIFGDAP